MARYIDVDAFRHRIHCQPKNMSANEVLELVSTMPTADVVSKEDAINELVKEISDRIIQAIEANYEIIPKKPVVRCKECKWWRDTDHTCREWGGASPRLANAFCSDGERRDDGEIH